MSDIEHWKKLSSKVILNHPKFRVYEDLVRLPDGTEDVYVKYATGDPDSVIAIAINSKNELLVQREYSYPPDRILWQLPGGSMHKNENILDAAIRELAEESGYSAKKQTVLGYFFTNNRHSARKQHVVLCTHLTKKKLPSDSDEYIESYWLPLDKVYALINRGEVTNINMLAALMIWQQKTS